MIKSLYLDSLAQKDIFSNLPVNHFLMLVDLDTPMRYYDAFITTISTQERLELITRVRRQAESLRGLRTLSYLWIPYHQVILEADVEFGVSCQRPYKGLPTFPATLQKILTREVASYGTNPARR